MAGRRTQSRVTPPVEDPDDFPEETPATVPELNPVDTDDGYEEWLRIQSELGSEEGKVILKRRNAKGQIGALGVMPSPEFSIERVIEDWGGGRYIAVVYDKTNTKIGQVTFEVDESVPQRTPKVVEPAPGPGVADIARFPQAMEDPRIAALERAVASTNDTMKALLFALVKERPQAQSAGTEALGLGLKIAEMMAARSAPPSFADIKDVFLAGLEAREAAENTDEGFMGVVKAFSPAIGKLVEKATSQPVPLPPPPPLIAGAAPPVIPPSASPSTVKEPPMVGPAWMLHLRPHLPRIQKWAKEGRDPEVYAGVILDELSEGQVEEVRAASKDPEFVSKTLAALPMFAPYSAWATTVLTTIKEMLVEDEPDSTTSEEGSVSA